MLGHPVVGSLGRHLPAGIAGGDYLNHRRALLGDGVAESLLYGILRLAHSSGSMHGLTGDVASAVELRHKLRYGEGITIEIHSAPIRGRGRLLPDEGGGGHLASGHAVNSVVDEYHDNILPPVGSMYRLGRADGSHVAVTLVSEDHVVRPEPAYGGGHGGSAPVGRLNPVYIHIIIGKHRAPHRRDTHRAFSQPHLGYHLREKLVNHTMAAAGAVVHMHVVKELRPAVDLVLLLHYIFQVHCVQI